MKLRYFLNQFNQFKLYNNTSKFYHNNFLLNKSNHLPILKRYLVHTMIKEARIVDVEKVAVIGSGNWYILLYILLSLENHFTLLQG